MFFCTLLLCQVSLAQQTAHVEGALLLGEKRNIRAGAGRVSGCNSERRRWEERWRLARSARASDLSSGMCSLVVATRQGDVFLLGAINAFIAGVQLWQRCYVNLCSHSGRSHRYYYLSRACLLGFPVTLVLARLHMGKGTVGSHFKALQPAVPGRSDLPEIARLSEVRVGNLLLARMLQMAPCSGTFLQVFQGLSSLLGQLGSLRICRVDHGLCCALSYGHLAVVTPLQILDTAVVAKYLLDEFCGL